MAWLAGQFCLLFIYGNLAPLLSIWEISARLQVPFPIIPQAEELYGFKISLCAIEIRFVIGINPLSYEHIEFVTKEIVVCRELGNQDYPG